MKLFYHLRHLMKYVIIYADDGKVFLGLPQRLTFDTEILTYTVVHNFNLFKFHYKK